MDQHTVLDERLGRRTFLKGSLAAAALATGGTSFLTSRPARASEASKKGDSLVSTSASADPTPYEDDEFGEHVCSGVCRCNCYGGCFLNVHVRDGKVVRTSARDLPEPEWNRICAKGLSHVFRIYDPQRVKHPMRRVGERGAGEWEQISWEEALSEISEKFKGYAEEFDPESVCYWYGSGNDSFANNYNRLWNYLGATNISQQLDMALFYATQKSLGVDLNFNGNEMSDLKNAKTIVIWGSNPAVSQMQGMHFILEARDAGAKLIAIDPVYSSTVAKCDQWVPIAPGTDGLLAMAIMNVIIENGWQDVDFLKTSTVAPFLVKRSDGTYLRKSDLDPSVSEEDDAILVTDGSGTFDVPEKITDPVIEGTFEVEGIEVDCAYTLLLDRLASYPVEDAARQCDVPVETIRGLAEDLALNTPATIYMLLGLDHYQNGFYSMFDICCIAALTGSAGKPGAFTGASESLFYFYDNPDNPYGANVEGAVGSKFTVPCTNMGEVMATKTFKGEPFEPKALWVARGNPLSNMCDRQYTLGWLDQIDFVVVADINMNEMARYADIVLPVCHWFEQEDYGATYPQNPFIEYQEKAIEPLYESKSDFDIVRALAETMGFGDKFDFTVADYLSEKLNVEPCISMGITYEAMREKKAIRGLPGSQDKPFIHAEGGVFPTATGRLEFYCEHPAVNTDFGQVADLSNETLPFWEPPCEVAAGRDPDPRFPFQILSDHQKLRTHTQWAAIAPVLELDPEPTVRLNPADAQTYGIEEGDMARIYNDRGSVTMRAHLSSGVRPGILLCSRGWDSNQYADGNLQDVLQANVHPVCVTQAFFDAIGAIEKVEG